MNGSHPAQIRRDSLTLVNPCWMTYVFIVVGRGRLCRSSLPVMGRRSSMSTSFVLGGHLGMSAVRALHVDVSSAPTDGSGRGRVGCRRWSPGAVAVRPAGLSAGELRPVGGCAVRPGPGPDLAGTVYRWAISTLAACSVTGRPSTSRSW